MSRFRRVLPSTLVLLLVTACGREVAPPAADPPARINEYPLQEVNPLGAALYPPDSTQFVVEVASGTDLGEIVDELGAQPVGVQQLATHAIVLFDAPPLVSAADFLSFAGVQTAGRNDRIDIFAEGGSLVIGFVDWVWFDSLATGQDAFAGLDLEAVHALATGAGVRVGIVDTGADTSHVLLADRIEEPQGEMEWVETCNELDDDDDGEIDEGCSHGTFVAGEVAIVAPGAGIMPIRALNSDGVGSVLDVIRAMRLLQENGCDVINLSLSLSGYHDQFEDVLQDLQAHGIAVVAAAGNAGGRHPLFPGISPYVIGAAAVDSTNALATFSGAGPLISLGAPGVAVTSAYLGGGTGMASGTSMATPVIASAIALVMEELGATPLQAVDRVLSYTGPIIPGTASQSGTVNPLAALTNSP